VLPLLVVALTPNGHPAPLARVPAAALLATVSAAFVVGTALEMR
jgi:hypothetical protein